MKRKNNKTRRKYDYFRHAAESHSGGQKILNLLSRGTDVKAPDPNYDPSMLHLLHMVYEF